MLAAVPRTVMCEGMLKLCDELLHREHGVERKILQGSGACGVVKTSSCKHALAQGR